MQAVLVLRDFFLSDFALIRLENSQHLSNLRNIFRFNAIWHKRFLAARVICRSLAENDVTVTPSVTCVD